MPSRKFVGTGVFVDGSSHLVNSSVELVNHGEDECFDRPRLDWRAMVARSMMRDDEVLDLRAEVVRESRDAVDGVAHEDQPESDMANQIAVASVGRTSGLVLQLLELPDVVQQHAGEHEVFVGFVRARD